MKYDFTTVMDRRGMDAIAVDEAPVPEGGRKEGFDVIPMWVADMNFATVPTVPEFITRRVQHPAYGYFAPRQEYYDAIIRWQRQRNGMEVTPEDIGYANGVLGGVVSALNVLCSRGDKVLVHSPTYIGFTHALGDNGYRIVHSPLTIDDQCIWRMDFDDMEKKIVEHNIHAAILCSPHNPCGRVWERWELEKAMELYKKYSCVVIADEIWADLVLPGNHHIPTQSVSEDARQRTVAFYAPSKTFNLAGLLGSYHIIYNPFLRDRVTKVSSLTHYNSSSIFAEVALLAAYTDEGCRWVDELCQVLDENVRLAYDFFTRRCRGVTLPRPEGTYLLYLDCTEWCREHGVSLDTLLRMGVSKGVIWQDGRPFGLNCSIRMNVALPTARVQEALERLDKYVFNA